MVIFKLKNTKFTTLILEDVDIENILVSNTYKNIGGLFPQMNKELKSISTWFKANKFSINIDKTKWTIYYPTSKKPFMLTEFPELFIDGVTLERETVTKFLVYLLMKMSHGKIMSTQFPPRFLKA